MSEKVDLICEYCGNEISLDDHKCPNCGANCSKIIKKYKDLEKQKEEEKAERILKTQEDITNVVLNSFKTSSKISFVIFGFVIFVFVFIFIMFIVTSFKHNDVNVKDDFDISNFEDKHDTVKVKYNELAELEDYTIMLSDYELYEYRSEHFSHLNTRDGYQKIAFHFIVENKSDSNMIVGVFDKITLTADDYAVQEADLEVNPLCEVVSGKASYDELNRNTIMPNNKLQGYVGFEVPVDKKELKFTFGDAIITMDNPAYK